ncbi:D-aminopeptidase [compost metagenome]
MVLALTQRAQCEPLLAVSPVRVEITATSPGMADLFCQWPTLERVDGCTVCFSAPEIESAVRMVNCLSAMSSMLR